MRMTQSSVAQPNATFSAAAPEVSGYTLPKAGMVESLSRGETVRVTIGGAGERSARRQRRQTMLRSEGIEVEREHRQLQEARKQYPRRADKRVAS